MSETKLSSVWPIIASLLVSAPAFAAGQTAGVAPPVSAATAPSQAQNIQFSSLNAQGVAFAGIKMGPKGPTRENPVGFAASSFIYFNVPGSKTVAATDTQFSYIGASGAVYKGWIVDGKPVITYSSVDATTASGKDQILQVQRELSNDLTSLRSGYEIAFTAYDQQQHLKDKPGQHDPNFLRALKADADRFKAFPFQFQFQGQVFSAREFSADWNQYSKTVIKYMGSNLEDLPKAALVPERPVPSANKTSTHHGNHPSVG